MKNIFEEASNLQKFLEKNNFQFCFIGGIALQRWGDLRTTNDIDLTLLTGFEGESKYIDILLQSYEGRLKNVRETALAARVLLLRSISGIGIDIALGGLPFEALSIERSSLSEFLPGIFLKTCSAEDLIVYKAFASRPKDWIDIEGVIFRQTKLDWKYIEQQLKPLLELKEELENWNTLLKLKLKKKL